MVTQASAGNLARSEADGEPVAGRDDRHATGQCGGI